MTVYLPDLDEEGKEIKIFKPKNSKYYIQNLYTKGNKEEIKIFINKPPIWNDSKFLIKY